jgi:hypothetical protein
MRWCITFACVGLALLLVGCDSAELLGIDTKLGDGDVKTKHLKDGAVTTDKLDDKSVTAPKIDSGSASTGRVLTSDGNGGATWEHVAGGGLPVVDSTNIVFGSADNTKLLRFEVDGFTAGQTRVMTPPDADITVAGINIAQTFALKQTFSVAPSAPVGTQNERFGEGAGAALGGGGQQNAFVGYNAGAVNTGSYNVALGAKALAANTNHINTAVGHQALSANVGNAYNTAVGAGAMKLHLSGEYNTAIGANAMLETASGAGESGSNNVAIGGSAMRQADTAHNNVAIGYGAGNTLGSGAVAANDNVLIGFQAGNSIDTGDGNIVLGSGADTSSAAASKEFVAGSGSYPVDNVYFGKGAVSGAPSAYTIRGTGGSGANVDGGDIQIAGGTGNAAADTGGSIVFQTAADGAGTVLTTKVKINPAGIMNTYMGADIDSAVAAGTVAPTGNVFKVTGVTGVTAIGTAGITAGTRITIIFTGALTVTDNDGTLNLAGNFVTTANDVLTLVYDGANWIEVSRSVN